MPEHPRRFHVSLDEEGFRGDLERYRDLALTLGATESKTVDQEAVIVDERVIARCASPRCVYYNTNLNCPPHSWTVDETRKIVGKYNQGIFVMLKVPPEEHASPVYDDSEKHKIPCALKMYEIVAKIQSAAFYDGYPLAIGFAGGPSCKRVFCPKVECSGLTGKGCRMHLKSNLTMHGVGMDAVTMAARVGWDVYPIGKRSCADQVPHGMELGLVLVH